MNSIFSSGRGQLRVSQAEQALHDVDYIIRVNTVIENDNAGAFAREKKIVNVHIRTADGRTFGNGIYLLEEGGNTLLRLFRTGSGWRALCPGYPLRIAGAPDSAENGGCLKSCAHAG